MWIEYILLYLRICPVVKQSNCLHSNFPDSVVRDVKEFDFGLGVRQQLKVKNRN